MTLTPEKKRELFRLMLLSRRLDERAWVLHRQNKISFHISAIGHEAAQVAAGLAMKPGIDWVLPYYRDLALMLTMGMKPRDYMLSLMGKAGSSSGGRQLPTNWNLKSGNVVSTSGLVASHILHAVGIAHALRLQRKDGVVLASCGEGATSTGEWYEAVNWAAVHHLPIVFLVQNNGLAISLRQEKQMAVRDVVTKASGLGLPGYKVDGKDTDEVFQTITKAVEEAREGLGTSLVEVVVQRIPPHSSDDDDRSYRTRAEVEDAKRQDPLRLLRNALLHENQLTREQLDEIEESVKAIVSDAVHWAEQAPYLRADEAAGPIFAPGVLDD